MKIVLIIVLLVFQIISTQSITPQSSSASGEGPSSQSSSASGEGPWYLDPPPSWMPPPPEWGPLPINMYTSYYGFTPHHVPSSLLNPMNSHHIINPSLYYHTYPGVSQSKLDYSNYKYMNPPYHTYTPRIVNSLTTPLSTVPYYNTIAYHQSHSVLLPYDSIRLAPS